MDFQITISAPSGKESGGSAVLLGKGPNISFIFFLFILLRMWYIKQYGSICLKIGRRSPLSDRSRGAVQS